MQLLSADLAYFERNPTYGGRVYQEYQVKQRLRILELKHTTLSESRSATLLHWCNG